MAEYEKMMVGKKEGEPIGIDHILAIQGDANRVLGRAETLRKIRTEEEKFIALTELLAAVERISDHALSLQIQALPYQEALMSTEVAARAGLIGKASVRLLVPRMAAEGENIDEYAIDSKGLVPSEEYESAATPRAVMARRTGLTVVKSGALLDRMLGEGVFTHYTTKTTIINLLAKPVHADSELQPGYSWQSGLDIMIKDHTIAPEVS